jgi:hypothetical protein
VRAAAEYVFGGASSLQSEIAIMKHLIVATVARASLAAALCLSAGGALAGDSKSAGPWYSLVGTWNSVITHVDCSNGQPANPPPFKVHESYHLGGTYSQFGSTLGNRRSDGYGVWRRTGRNTFEVSVTFFRFDDATGAMPTAVLRIDRQITMSGSNNLTSINRTTVTSLDGTTVLNRTCSNDVAERFRL